MSLETPSNPCDRRMHPRRSTNGQVKLRPEVFAAVSIPGQIVDVSSSGFRARHGLQTLASGTIVEFAYRSLEGRARVVWTRILSDSVESGFQILPRPQD